MTAIVVRPADLTQHDEADAVVALIDSYARELNSGTGLRRSVRARLPEALLARPQVLVYLAWSGEQAVGVLVAVEGFSTFSAQPLLNVHDVAVLPNFRRQGVARQLFDALTERARAMDCAKLTLEVLEGNRAARRLYGDLGFVSYELDPAMGRALFLEKTL